MEPSANDVVKAVYRTHIKYIRTPEKKKVGMLYASVTPEGVRIGWSKCNTHMGDVFDRKKGLLIAQNRAYHPRHEHQNRGDKGPLIAPHCIFDDMLDFAARLHRLYPMAPELWFYIRSMPVPRKIKKSKLDSEQIC